MPVQAIWNGTVLAESDQTIVVEGNHYFPPDSINKEHFRRSAHTSVCFWKGQANYYDVEVDGQINRNAAWYYPAPSDAARQIRGYVAFGNGVRITRENPDGWEDRAAAFVSELKWKARQALVRDSRKSPTIASRNMTMWAAINAPAPVPASASATSGR